MKSKAEGLVGAWDSSAIGAIPIAQVGRATIGIVCSGDATVHECYHVVRACPVSWLRGLHRDIEVYIETFANSRSCPRSTSIDLSTDTWEFL